MAPQPLGFIPLIPLIPSFISAAAGLFGGSKKKKAAERMNQYAANEQKILSGQAVAATDVMTEADKAFLRKVWPQVHGAANWTDINWASIGVPGGPPLTPAAAVAIKNAWPTVHVAGNFDDVQWQYHAVPNDLVGALLPLPELGYRTPSADSPGDYSGYLPGQFPSQYQTASTFSGQAAPILIAGGVGLALLLLLNSRR